MSGPTPDFRTGPLTILSQDEQLLQATVREFATRDVQPLVAPMDADAAIPSSLIDGLFALGAMGLTVPEVHGGTGSPLFHAVLAVEALAEVDPAVALVLDVHTTLVTNAIQRWARPEVQATWLPQLAMRTVGAYALSEASSGSDAFALQTRAIDTADGYRLTGRKLWITNAAEAGLFIVFATVNPDAGRRGVTAFLVARDTPGFTVGRREHKLGIRASSTCEVMLDDCLIPSSHVLGDVGQGYKVAIETLNEGRIGIGAQMVGLASAALAHAVRHTRQRTQFGKPLADFQGVQFQIARAAMEVESARLLVYNAARLCDAGLPFVTEAAMAKLHASEVAERTASLAVNLFGGAGFITDSPVEKLYRDAKIGQIYEGASNLQLLTIAKRTIGE